MTGQGDDAPPRDDELFRRQDALQQEAREVLAATGLLDLLDRLGKPFVIGSYAHGLMVWRDLDIVILAPGLRGDRPARPPRPAGKALRDRQLRARAHGLARPGHRHPGARAAR
jgi:hypothetical protein